MKKHQLILAAAFLGSILTASAALNIPSDGSDGALNITEDTVIDLSKAVTGTWNQNNSANAGKGVYDPEKWAIVFKYSSVNVAGVSNGSPPFSTPAKVTFINHSNRAPVVWLVQGNVTIDGTVSVAGGKWTNDVVGRLTPSQPGPGGFRGGARGPSGVGAGYGPGGGTANGNGYYGTVYGNPQIIPLIGGSGSGAVDPYWGPGNGASGGGAILIAAGGTVSINGLIDANGGNSPSDGQYFGNSSGGAVRIIGEHVTGAGEIRAICATTPNYGRIRIETANPLSASIRTFPETIGVPPANPPIIWPAANAPKARVISVDAQPAPADPSSPLIASADVAIQNNAPVNILIETRDFPIEGVVQLFIIPKFAGRTTLVATRINGDINLATWSVTTTLPNGFVTLQARATQP